MSTFGGKGEKAAYYYCTAYGFTPIAYSGLETGVRTVVSHVVRQGQITLVLQSPLEPGNKEMGNHMERHGDQTQDIAFQVSDIHKLQKRLKSNGAKLLRDVWTENDKDGSVSFLTLQAFGDTVHTFVDISNYKGEFLPGYSSSELSLPLLDNLPPTGFLSIDHIVGNQHEGDLDKVVDWYVKMFGFHRFWSVDDRLISSKNTGLKTMVITNWEENIKLTIAQPAPSNRRAGTSQVEEFLRYNDGPGLLHIAALTDDIIGTVSAMRKRGVKFLRVPRTYYGLIWDRMEKGGALGMVKEDKSEVEEQHVMVDFDQNGYLLQIFAQHLCDRPTMYFEIIQRHNHNGFGAANVRALTEAVELQQAKRGNLFAQPTSFDAENN